jgi:two-component system sensor histidine kinase KdpD
MSLKRVYFLDHIDRVKQIAETDRLRSALLSSISHDLRTPLAAVLGRAGSLRDFPEASTTVPRLISLRPSSGAVIPNTALYDIGEIVGTALQRTCKMLANHGVDIAIGSDLPMVMMDPVLFEQVLFNLLDNAAKYAAPNTSWPPARNEKGRRPPFRPHASVAFLMIAATSCGRDT